MELEYTDASRPEDGDGRVGPSVFRGFEALGVDLSVLARIGNAPLEEVHSWRYGLKPLPAEWAILLTRLLASWVRAFETPAGHVPGDAPPYWRDEQRGLLEVARNWLHLAEESLKDLPPTAYEDAWERLRDRDAA